MKKYLLLLTLVLNPVNTFSADLFTEEFTGKISDLRTCWRSEGGYSIVTVKNNAGVEKGAYWGAGDANASIDGMKRGMYSSLLSAYTTGKDVIIMTTPLANLSVPICGLAQSHVLYGVRLTAN